MRLTIVRDDDADTVTITLHGLAGADPDTVADHAWAAVAHALTPDFEDPT